MGYSYPRRAVKAYIGTRTDHGFKYISGRVRRSTTVLLEIAGKYRHEPGRAPDSSFVTPRPQSRKRASPVGAAGARAPATAGAAPRKWGDERNATNSVPRCGQLLEWSIVLAWYPARSTHRTRRQHVMYNGAYLRAMTPSQCVNQETYGYWQSESY